MSSVLSHKFLAFERARAFVGGGAGPLRPVASIRSSWWHPADKLLLYHPQARHPLRAVLAWQSSALPRAAPDQLGPIAKGRNEVTGRVGRALH